MPICSFSGKEIPPGTGIMYVKNDGKVLWFLNGKAEKNFIKLRRKPRNTTWTEEAHTLKASKSKAKSASDAVKGSDNTKAHLKKAAGRRVEKERVLKKNERVGADVKSRQKKIDNGAQGGSV